MGHGAEHHIEHAEHAAHASHDSFDKRVTISIAIVAAVLAAVTMLGHRAHNQTLALQNEAALQQNLATNKWGEYQAYNVRSHLYQSLGELASFSAPVAGSEKKFTDATARWAGQVDKYETKNMPRTKEEAEKHSDAAQAKLHESHEVHERSARFDLGELFLQLGVVLCSLAILTKRNGFWYIGLLCALGGLGIAVTGYFGVAMGGSSH